MVTKKVISRMWVLSGTGTFSKSHGLAWIIITRSRGIGWQWRRTYINGLVIWVSCWWMSMGGDDGSWGFWSRLGLEKALGIVDSTNGI